MQTKSLQMKRVLRTALLILLLCVVGMGNGYAYDFVVNGIYYNITSSSGLKTVEVTYKDEYNVGHSYSGNISIPNTVTYSGNVFTVTEIGNYAFHLCDQMTSINFPNTITSIKYMAFSYCRGLTSIIIPESIETIEVYAFSNCTNLSTINFNAVNCTQIGGTYPSGWEMAFVVCSALTTLNIGETVQNIPSMAFKDCTSLTTINFNATNCTIHPDAFEGCTSLKTLNYGNGVEFIDAYWVGWHSYNNLHNINIPNSVTSIEGSFNNTGWYNSQHDGILYLDNWCVGYKGNKPTGNLVIQNGITGIKADALRNLEIESIEIPNSTLYIGNRSFYECNLINEIIIPNNVLSIGESAFKYCSSLVSVTLGGSLTKLDNKVFNNCQNLNTIISLNTIPPELGNNVFDGISPVATLIVPCGIQLAYFSSWNIFEYYNIHEDCTPRPVSINSNINGGTITPSVSQATMGQEVLLTVVPNSGMALSSITVYNATDPSQIIPVTLIGKTTSMYSFVMPPYGVAVSATFEQGTTYSITISPSMSGGSITASTYSASEGEIVTLNVHPNSGYGLQSLTVCNANDASQTVAVTNNTFIMPSFNVMVSASFNYTSVDENGCVSVSIHPNPTLGIIIIEAENLKHIYICNILGQVIFESKASDNEFEYDFNKHGEGIYLIRIETASGVVTKRVVVSR